MATHSRSCLENPRNGGAWWAAVYGVAQSQTRLKRLSSSSCSYTHKCLDGFGRGNLSRATSNPNALSLPFKRVVSGHLLGLPW